MKNNLRKITVTAILSAVAAVLMFLEFSVPIMPSFIKFDFSETPALRASFALGPWWGVAVCFIKNLIKIILGSNTACVGELCNFLLGAAFVLPAGYLYRFRKTRSMALVGTLVGAFVMAVFSLPLNYYVTYPIYANFMPMDAIIGMYQQIFGGVDGLFSCLLIFNVPFTFVKGLVDSAVTFLLYKRLSPILKGVKQNSAS